MEVIIPSLIVVFLMGLLLPSSNTEHSSEPEEKTTNNNSPLIKQLEGSLTQIQSHTKQLRLSIEALRKIGEKQSIRRELLDLKRKEFYKHLELAEAQIKKEGLSKDPPPSEPTSEGP